QTTRGLSHLTRPRSAPPRRITGIGGVLPGGRRWGAPIKGGTPENRLSTPLPHLWLPPSRNPISLQPLRPLSQNGYVPILTRRTHLEAGPRVDKAGPMGTRLRRRLFPAGNKPRIQPHEVLPALFTPRSSLGQGDDLPSTQTWLLSMRQPGAPRD